MFAVLAFANPIQDNNWARDMYARTEGHALSSADAMYVYVSSLRFCSDM
jgi:hypothetical protein